TELMPPAINAAAAATRMWRRSTDAISSVLYLAEPQHASSSCCCVLRNLAARAGGGTRPGCLLVLGGINVLANECNHIGWTIHTREPGVEDQGGHSRCSLDLGFKNVRLQPVEQAMVQQLGRHLISHRPSGLNKHFICYSRRLCREDRHPDRREDVEVVCLSGQERLSIEVNRRELDAGGVDRLAL